MHEHHLEEIETHGPLSDHWQQFRTMIAPTLDRLNIPCELMQYVFFAGSRATLDVWAGPEDFASVAARFRAVDDEMCDFAEQAAIIWGRIQHEKTARRPRKC